MHAFFFENQVYSTDMCFGLGYDCYFKEDEICLTYYEGERIKELSHIGVADNFNIPYAKVETISLSLSRKPYSKLFLVKPYDYTLDLCIKTNQDFCSHSILLETRAFSGIEDLCRFLQQKKVIVQDSLHILTDYSGNYEEIKVKLNEKYDVLKEQFGLINFRMTDSKM